MQRRSISRRSAIVLIIALAMSTALLGGNSASANVTDGIPARIVRIDPQVSSGTYETIDYGQKASAKDDRRATTNWRVVMGTGNCCENYLTTSPSGRLLDFGGTYINYSDDRGQTWYQVQPLAPLVNGEGAIVAAPGGDVLGVQWDPYSGDHLQFYKFEGDTQQWLYTEMPVHQPFYDREWIAVVPGPVTIDGQTYEYVSFVKGGWPSKEIWFYSTDGLNYTQLTSTVLEQITSGASVTGALPVASNPDNDWVQPITSGRITPLGHGDALAGPDYLEAEWALLEGDTFAWAAYRFPDGSLPQGLFQTDSAGRLHNVIPAGNGASFEYRISADGGETWKTQMINLPDNYSIEEIDFRAHHAAGVAAVATRAEDLVSGLDQDFVFKFDITGAGARLIRRYEVGLGDAGATGGVGNSVRFDFETVTIFADGRVAVSFLDSTTTRRSSTTGNESLAPAVAIELDTTLGEKLPVEEQQPPVLGEPYASYTFDTDAQNWTTSGVQQWLRSAPGTKSGADDPATASFGLDGLMYTDNASATLTSPVITTAGGQTVLEFWLKTDLEDGYDYLWVEWSADQQNWVPLAQYTGGELAYDTWQKVTLGFTAPDGGIQVRFRFASDLLCSGVTLCERHYQGARVDEVVIGKQATN